MGLIKFSEQCGRCPREDLTEVTIEEAETEILAATRLVGIRRGARSRILLSKLSSLQRAGI